ncbi:MULTISPECIES: hypothetical protein [unclassified Caballeronia]|uniref:hypothetical protein n=1 Tax=unclassified Caballeronia TaxID=2646786 RepID=UPI001F26EF8B|nr:MULTISPECIES: hypothetical protein [unclassified Caballeronia]MCE4544609.1 hypothetical protein [Caballeronia sp. PC1]MCE4571761.1 hypothetical protein [Caballeronia sp. CLC5]
MAFGPVQLAGMLARDPQFQQWVAQWMVPPRAVDADVAAQFIRTVCEVTSRRELATNRDAEQRFHNFLRKPFVEWRERQAEHA